MLQHVILTVFFKYTTKSFYDVYFNLIDLQLDFFFFTFRQKKKCPASSVTRFLKLLISLIFSFAKYFFLSLKPPIEIATAYMWL